MNFNIFKCGFVLSLSVLLGSCSGDDAAQLNLNEDGLIVLNASSGSQSDAELDTRINVEKESFSYRLGWENTPLKSDRFSVYNTTSGVYVGDFEYIGEDGSTGGDFVQTSNFDMPYGGYTAVYPAVDAETYSTLDERNAAIENVENLKNQAAIGLDELGDNLAMTANFTYNAEQPNISFSFEHQFAYIKFCFKLESGKTPNEIVFEDKEANRYTVNSTGLVAVDGENNVYEVIIKVTQNPEAKYLYFYVEDSEALQNHHFLRPDLMPQFENGKIYEATIDEFNGKSPII